MGRESMLSKKFFWGFVGKKGHSIKIQERSTKIECFLKKNNLMVL